MTEFKGQQFFTYERLQTKSTAKIQLQKLLPGILQLDTHSLIQRSIPFSTCQQSGLCSSAELEDDVRVPAAQITAGL